ncbi:hypothetical protein GN316_19000 [Xylophilus sp. Kf1]|nr:hypothetical protein [Xylophilus sp. Kf1]
MSYAVEAVRWTDDRLVHLVLWHYFEYVEDGLKAGPSVVRKMRDVAKEAERGHDLYLCYKGAVGRRIAVHVLKDGRQTLVDLPSGDPAQALADLPTL